MGSAVNETELPEKAFPRRRSDRHKGCQTNCTRRYGNIRIQHLITSDVWKYSYHNGWVRDKPRANMTLLTTLQPTKPNTWPDRRLSSRRAFSNCSSVRGTHIYRLQTEVPRVFQTHLDEVFTHEKSTSRCVIGPSGLLAARRNLIIPKLYYRARWAYFCRVQLLVVRCV